MRFCVVDSIRKSIEIFGQVDPLQLLNPVKPDVNNDKPMT
jgi:hypothetical protein